MKYVTSALLLLMMLTAFGQPGIAQELHKELAKEYESIAGSWQFNMNGEIFRVEMLLDDGILSFYSPTSGERLVLTPVMDQELEYKIVEVDNVNGEIVEGLFIMKFKKDDQGNIRKCEAKWVNRGVEFSGTKTKDRKK